MDEWNDTDHGFFAHGPRDDENHEVRALAIRRAVAAGRAPTQQEMYGPPNAKARAQHRIGYGADGNIYDSEEHWQEQQKVWADAFIASVKASGERE